MIQLVNVVLEAAQKQFDEIAERVYQDLKAEAQASIKDKAHSSGEMVRSIQKQKISDTTYFIGGQNDHLYYKNYGSGVGYPIRAKALHFAQYDKDGKQVWRPYSGAYEGAHFVEKVADKYR